MELIMIVGNLLSNDENETPLKELITIIIPARNEEDNIQRLEQELLKVLNPLPFDYEFIVIDNASTDQTGKKVKEICDRDLRWKYFRFSRNFTVEMSITAGYHFAKGDAIIVLYSDLQDPPDVIPGFIKKWKEGYDVVYGVRLKRTGDPAWRNSLIFIAYRIINWFSEIQIPTDAGDFRLITKQVRDALDTCEESNRYMRGLITWLGFRQVGVIYERRPRTNGKSKAPFWDTIIFTINAITSFSQTPLRLFTFLGFGIILICIIAILFYSILWVLGFAPPGITTLVVLSFLGIGLNSIGIGVLGEYIGRIYTETKNRPKYIIQESYPIKKR